MREHGADNISDTALAFSRPFVNSCFLQPLDMFKQRIESMRLASMFVILALTACGCENGDRTTVDSDNSAINERDRSDSAKTPLDQNQNQKDIDITADIRKQVVDSEMSVNAQNVKIITQNGNVTLRRPVTTEDEKTRIEAIAREVAGETNVDNQLDVTP